MHLKNYHKLKETIFYESGYIDFSIYHAKLIEKTGGIIEERIYLGGYEVFRKTISGTLDFERETLHISDDTKKIASVETKTFENGSAISTPVSNIRYQYDNHLGSASLELDENAAIISYEEYHPFGMTSYRSGRTETEVSLKRYKYVGKERDEETGLYYYGARYYAGWVARFVSVDPLQFDYPQLTPYNYAGNKPITHIDIDGMQSTGDYPIKADNTNIVRNPINPEKFKPATQANNLVNGVTVNSNDAPPLTLPNNLDKPVFPKTKMTLDEYKVITVGIRQKLQLEGAEDNSLIKFEATTEAGFAIGGKLKFFGVGGQLKIGVATPLTEAVYTENGISTGDIVRTKGFFNMKAGGGMGFGAFGTSVSLDRNTSVTSNIGPFEGTMTRTDMNLRITVFDIGLTIFGG
jgi:RHS repeat-associated protein